MTDYEMLKIARTILSYDEFRVWFAKYYDEKGRRSGSVALGISEDAFRYRLKRAEEKMAPHIEKETAA